MEYAALAEAYARAETTQKRLELAEIVAGLLEDTPLPLVPVVVHLTQGRIAPPFEGIELGLSEKLAVEAIASVSGAPPDVVYKARNEHGDIGSGAEQLLRKKAQATLFAVPLTVENVHAALLEIANAKGAGSQERKLRILQRLMSGADPLEAKYILRTVTGRLRLGIQDATVIEATTALVTDGHVRSVTEQEAEERTLRAEAKRLLERANDVGSDLGHVAQTALRPFKDAEKRLAERPRVELTHEALVALQAIHMRVGVPLRPMLAERSSSAAEIIDRLGGRAGLEMKYDGLRVQAHIPADGAADVRLFSRRLEDLTPQFPDIITSLKQAFAGHAVIVEGEAVAIDTETGRMRPFQELSQRRGRKHGIQERRELSASEEFGLDGLGALRGGEILHSVPIAVYLFDLLYLDGTEHLDTPYEARRQILHDTCQQSERVAVAAQRWATTAEDIDAFLHDALVAGAEGLMAKKPESRYKAGAREWSWIKFKADYVEGLADTLDLAIVGAYYGQGRRKGWYGAYLLAAWDPDAAQWVTVCRVATGFNDATLLELTQELEEEARPTPPKNLFHKSIEKPDVWFEPRLVLEVSGAEFTLSPVHTACWGVLRENAGIAVRFPRYTGRMRDDKDPTDTTRPAEIAQMYERQVKIRTGAA